MLCVLFKLWNTQRTRIYISASRLSTSLKISTRWDTYESICTHHRLTNLSLRSKEEKKLNVSQTSSLPNLDGFTEVLAHVAMYVVDKEFVLGLFTW